MFFDPAKTGLVVLGASHFPECEDLDRKVFANARTAIVSYFRNSSRGLGLIGRNIFDGFGREGPKEALLLDLDRFLSTHTFSDIFVYICTHGYVDGGYLRLLIRDSKGFDEDTSINFERLYERVEDASGCRIYFLVDCCASGAIHKLSPDFPISPEAASYLSSAETVLLPRRGTAILTANNSTHVGTVYSPDNLPDLDLPIFTKALMDLLHDGNMERTGFGLSLGQVADDLTKRIPKLIAAMSATQEAAGEDSLADVHGTMVPQVSDRPVFDDQDGNLISRIGVFPNNVPQLQLISRVARSIRINYRRASEQWDEISEQKVRIEDLERTAGEARTERDHLKGEVDKLKSQLKTAEDERDQAKQQKKIYAGLCVAAGAAVLAGLLWGTQSIPIP